MTKWKHQLTQIFPAALPDRAGWTQLSDIGVMLSAMADTADLLMQIPGCEPHMINGQIRLRSKHVMEIPTDRGIVLCSPSLLRLESFGVDMADHLFLWMELYPIPITPFMRDNYPPWTERLCEIADEVFLHGDYWDSQKLPNGEPLPERSRLVYRCLSGNVLFHKRGQLEWIDTRDLVDESADELRDRIETALRTVETDQG
jgi:hypothetical protein